ncbi:hypothetical protein BaRGS_00010131, partial [Batillaria attramentaria]
YFTPNSAAERNKSETITTTTTATTSTLTQSDATEHGPETGTEVKGDPIIPG